MKPKIVRIFSRLNVGGPALQVTFLSEALSDHYETILITGAVGKSEGDMSYLMRDPKRYRHHFIPELGRNIKFGKDVIAFWKILTLLRREKPLIVHTHTSKAGVLGRMAAFLAGTPIIVHTFHGHVFNGYYGKMKTRFIILLEKILALLSSRIIAISHKQKEDLISTFRISKSQKLSVVPLGFDLDPFLNNAYKNVNAKEQLGLPVDKFCIGMVGRLVPIKNHDLFLRICSKIYKQRQDVHFVIVGDGECYQQITQQAEAYKLISQVTFLGWKKEMDRVYRGLDVVVLTSINEGTPVTLIEAQASGCPVVATRVGGTEDVVSSGKTGYVLDIHDEDGFVKVILELLSDEQKRKDMGSQGQCWVKEKFHDQRLLADVKALYIEVIKEKCL